jgi:hypothetical protein
MDEWHFTVRHSKHKNYKASTTHVAYPTFRRLDATTQHSLVSMTLVNVLPRTIGAALRGDGHGKEIVMKDNYNTRQKIRIDALYR